jgi:hypothetical protein
VKLIVLSSCYTDASAEALLEHIDSVVGIGSSHHADTPRAFAVGFYGALGEKESVASAYRHGSTLAIAATMQSQIAAASERMTNSVPNG